MHTRTLVGSLMVGLVLSLGVVAAAAAPAAVDLDVDFGHSCAVTECGDVICWGDNAHGKAASRYHTVDPLTPYWLRVPKFSKVTTGPSHTCALDVNGNIHCWGYAPIPPPQGQFIDIDAGTWETCALRADRTVHCWGSSSGIQPPAGQFRDISVGYAHSCALRQDRTEVVCWGPVFEEELYEEEHADSVHIDDLAFPGAEYLTSVSAGGYHTCATSTGGYVYCWGSDYSNQIDGTLGFPSTDPRVIQYSGGKGHRAVSAGSYGTLAIWRNPAYTSPWDNLARGWGFPWDLAARNPSMYPQYAIPRDPPKRLAMGYDHACMITAADEVLCWGGNAAGKAAVPEALNQECRRHISPFPPFELFLQ